jgi:hypothetical protein
LRYFNPVRHYPTALGPHILGQKSKRGYFLNEIKKDKPEIDLLQTKTSVMFMRFERYS